MDEHFLLGPDAVNRAVSYIGQHFRSPGLNRSVIARALGVSDSSLAHQVKASTGRSLREHVTGVRLNESQRLLTNSTESVKAIAIHVGFTSANAFTKCFCRAFRSSPTEWRNRIKGESHSRWLNANDCG